MELTAQLPLFTVTDLSRVPWEIDDEFISYFDVN